MSDSLNDLFTLLRFQSISTDSSKTKELHDCALWLCEKLDEMGLDSHLHKTEGHPLVVAHSPKRADLPTVLIYGHYDVQPVDPIEQWSTPPFEPTLKSGVVYARGATDNKGQIMAHILGVEELLHASGELPVNLIFLIEGEEEIGSPSLPAFLEEHRKDLECDLVLVSDTGMVDKGVPTLSYGLRGVTCADLIIHGPSHDLHSGCYGGAVANPALVLSRLLATLHDENGVVAVERFNSQVQPIASWEREKWGEISGVEDSDILEQTGAPAVYGEKGYSTAERLWARPTIEINGIYGGYQGEGSKTVIPASAGAKISCRLVPEQEPEEILACLEAHFQKHCPEGVRMEFIPGHSGSPYLTNPDSPFGKIAQESLREIFGQEPALIREGGSIPIIQSFKEILGKDSLLIGLADPDCNIHAPDENFPVANFDAGIRLNKLLLQKIGEASEDK